MSYVYMLPCRAYKSGSVSGVAEVRELLDSALGPKTLCCPGNLSPVVSGGVPGLATRHTHPFDRWVSSRCKVLHNEAERSDLR